MELAIRRDLSVDEESNIRYKVGYGTTAFNLVLPFPWVEPGTLVDIVVRCINHSTNVILYNGKLIMTQLMMG